jgi:hypothetical protein
VLRSNLHCRNHGAARKDRGHPAFMALPARKCKRRESRLNSPRSHIEYLMLRVGLCLHTFLAKTRTFVKMTKVHRAFR